MTKTGSLMKRNTLWLFAGQGLRLAVQALYFTVIARSLGVKNYGAFVGVVALVGTLYPFGTLGSGNLLIKHVARDKRTFAPMWGAALITTTLCGAVLIATVMLLSRIFLPIAIPSRLVLLVALSDIIGLNVITLAGQAFQAFEQLQWTATIYLCISTGRLTGALVLLLFHRHPSPLQWGYVYFASSAVVALGAYCLVCARLGSPLLWIRRSWAEFREGFYFSLSLGAQTVYNDIDKSMLVRLSTLNAAGIYGAAYRLIDVSFSPVSALLGAAYPDFFREGRGGVSASFAYAKPLLLRAMCYAVLAGLLVFCLAGVVPIVLGSEYSKSTEALRWLCPLPLLKAIHYFLSDSLTGAGHQGLRSAIQTSIALFNILTNLWLIPRYSWRGAAWSSIATDALLAAAVGAAVVVVSHRSRLPIHADRVPA